MTSSDEEDVFAEIDDHEQSSTHTEPALPTKRRRSHLWKRWIVFKSQNRTSDAFKDQPEVTELQMKGYFFWYAKINKRDVSPSTLAAYVWSFGKACWDETRQHIDNEILQRVRQYCLTYVTQKLNLKEVVSRAPLATHEDLKILLNCLWGPDQHVFLNERHRIQLSWVMKVLAYTAARPGAITVSNAYPGSNEAITYKDIDFQLVRRGADRNGKPRATLTIQFNYLKGGRKKPNSFIKLTLKEDREKPSECPILDFYAMADADNAWKHFRSSAELHRYRLPEGRNDLPIEIKTEVLNTPVLRSIGSRGDNNISDTLAWTCAAMAQAVGAVSLRAGFKNSARPYDFRRGGSNVLQMIATETELCQHMGHKSSRIMQNYISKHVGIDLQGLYTKGIAEQQHIDQLRSLNNGMREGAPYRLSSKEREEILKNPEYLDLVQQRNASFARLADLLGPNNKFPVWNNFVSRPAVLRFITNLGVTNNEQVAQDVINAIEESFEKFKNVRNCSKKLQRDDLSRRRDLWFEQGVADDSMYRPSTEPADDREELPNGPRVTPLVPEYRRPIFNLLYQTETPLNDDQLCEISAHLAHLCTKDSDPTEDRAMEGCAAIETLSIHNDTAWIHRESTTDQDGSNERSNWHTTSVDPAHFTPVQINATSHRIRRRIARISKKDDRCVRSLMLELDQRSGKVLDAKVLRKKQNDMDMDKGNRKNHTNVTTLRKEVEYDSATGKLVTRFVWE